MKYNKNWSKVLVSSGVYYIHGGTFVPTGETTLSYFLEVEFFDHITNSIVSILVDEELRGTFKYNIKEYVMLLSKDGIHYTKIRKMPVSVMCEEYPEVLI